MVEGATCAAAASRSSLSAASIMAQSLADTGLKQRSAFLETGLLSTAQIRDLTCRTR